MKQAIHLLDPVKGHQLGAQFPTMRCGRTQNFNSAKPLHTTNPAEVTCTSCHSYINNPWRVMRKYGKVKVLENNFAIIWGDYGYKIDMVAVISFGPLWQIRMSYKNQSLIDRYVEAGDMAELGFKMLEIIEEMIMNTNQ
jgi:hypothetical protein